jgi:peptide/nickel transport system substrate-binding protein
MVPNNPETRQVAEVIQAMAAEAGFDMKLRVTEFATSLTEAEAGRYQAYMLAWSGRTDPDGNIYSFAKTGQPNNYSGYSDPEVDALLDEARAKSSIAERKAIYEKATARMLDEGGIIYLYHRLVIIAHSTRLSGYTQMPDGLVRVKDLKLN